MQNNQRRETVEDASLNNSKPSNNTTPTHILLLKTPIDLYSVQN